MYYQQKIIVFFILLFLIYGYREQLKIHLLNQLVILRGILAPNCFWFRISDFLLSDGAGVYLYNNFKEKYGDFVSSNMFGNNIYIVTNNNYIKII